MTMSHTVTMTGLIEWLLADPKVENVSVESPNHSLVVRFASPGGG